MTRAQGKKITAALLIGGVSTLVVVGAFLARYNAQKRWAERLFWRCDECGLAGSGGTFHDIEIAWAIHDEAGTCGRTWGTPLASENGARG
jgi:hypothetical protein